MNKSKVLKTSLKAVAFTGVFSLIASAQAAFVALPEPTPEVPGALLGGLTLTGGGTVLASQTSPFANAFTTGTLLTFVVDRDPSPAVALDFYYQVINSTPAPDSIGDEQIFRFKTIGGFDASSNPVLVAQTDVNPVSGLAVSGLKSARTADRGEGSPFSVGFEFPVAPGGFASSPLSIASGESSTFMVVRTNSSSFASTFADVSSNGDSSRVGTFAAVPEPSSILFGLGMFGVALTNRAKRRASK